MELLKKLLSEISLKENTIRLHTVGKTHDVPFLTKTTATGIANAEASNSGFEATENDAHLDLAGSPASPMSSDMTRARIADAVNLRHPIPRKSAVAVESQTTSGTSDVPVMDRGEDDDEDTDDEEDGDVEASKAEVVRYEGV